MKKFTNYGACLLFFFIGNLSTWAQGPNDSGTYYQDADGYKGSALKTAFYKIINSHTTLGYSSLGNHYSQTDKRDDGKLWDIYSNVTNYTFSSNGGNSAEGAGWNKEHTIPQSWFGEALPMKSDIVHVIPTDAYVNNRRSNYPYGEVSSVSWSSKNDFSKVGNCNSSLGYSGTVFEPNDEYKGDIARIYFYMATCYENSVSTWTKNSQATAVMAANKYPAFKDWFLQMLLRWSKNDPVSQKEIDRNAGVAKVQGNRNPFVDYPGLEQYIWGSYTDKAFSYDNYESGGGGSDPEDPQVVPDIPTACQAYGVTDSSFYAYWIDSDNATSYTLELTQTETGAKPDSTYISEEFSKAKSSTTLGINSYTQSQGWVATKLFAGDGCLKFGSGSAGGSLISPQLPCPNGHVIVKIKSSTYGSDATLVSINLLNTSGTVIETKQISPASTETLYSVTFENVTQDYKISLTNPKGQRYYLYAIDIVAGGGATSKVTTVEGIKDSYYYFTGLSNKNTYSYKVKGVNDVGSSEWSSSIEVTLKSSHTPGDANGDGNVDVSDITAIATYILNPETSTVTHENADTNSDGLVDVSDITATAAIILNP